MNVNSNDEWEDQAAGAAGCVTRPSRLATTAIVLWLVTFVILIGLIASVLLFRFFNAEASKHRYALAGDLLANECFDVDRLNALLSHRTTPGEYTPLVPYEQNRTIPPIGFRMVASEVLGGRVSAYHALPFWIAWGTGVVGLMCVAGQAWRASRGAAAGMVH